MIRLLGILILGAVFSSSGMALDIIELEDHGKTTKFGYYMVHFKLDDPDNEYPLNEVYVLLASVDTVLEANYKGEYRLGVYLGYKDTSYNLHIGNLAFTDKENKHWKPGRYFVTGWSVYPRDRASGPQSIELPYKHPTVANLVAWTKMGTSEFGQQADADGLVKAERASEGCTKYIGDEYEFDYKYELETCREQKMVQLKYGMFTTKYESELDWIKSSLASLKAQLEPHYVQTKQMGEFPTKVYKFKSGNIIYAVYLIEDLDCIMSNSLCYEGWVTIKWAYLD